MGYSQIFEIIGMLERSSREYSKSVALYGCIAQSDDPQRRVGQG